MKHLSQLALALGGAVALLFPVLLASQAASLAVPSTFISDEVADDGATVRSAQKRR